MKHFNGPYIIKMDKLKSMVKPLTDTEFSELQQCKSLHRLIVTFVKHVGINNYHNVSYWKIFKKCLRTQLQLINDFDSVEKLLNSAYMVLNLNKKSHAKYCTLLEILGFHFFNNAKIEASIEQYSDIYDNWMEIEYNTTTTTITNEINKNNKKQKTHKVSFETCNIIWSIICLILENGSNPFIYVNWNSSAKLVKSHQNFRSVINYYNALYIMYKKGVINESELQNRFLYIISFAKESWKESKVKPKPSIITYCRYGNMYYWFGGIVDSTLNPMLLPKIAMKLLLMGYDLYHECKCNKTKYHDYSYKFIVNQQDYLQFSSCLNSYHPITSRRSVFIDPNDNNFGYFIDFLYYMKYADHTDSLSYFNDKKWRYRVLKRLPLLDKEWLIFIGNMVYPKIINEIDEYLEELLGENGENIQDEYFVIYNAWINKNYQYSYITRLIPFAGFIYGEQMKKLIRFYCYHTTPYLAHILNTNYQFSETWNGSLLFEILSDKKIPKKNIIFIIDHIHEIYRDVYNEEGLYRTAEIFDLVFTFKWDKNDKLIWKNMLLLFNQNNDYKYFKYSINAHFDKLCEKSYEQKLSFFLNNKILSIKYCAEITGLMYHRLKYLIINANKMNLYSIGRIFHWIIHEYAKCDNVREKQLIRSEIINLLRNSNVRQYSKNNKMIQQHFQNLIKLTS